MILIHTRAKDETTTDVIQWLVYYKKDFRRLNTIQELAQWNAAGKLSAFRSCYFNGKSALIPPVSSDREMDAQLREHLKGQAETFLAATLYGSHKGFGNNPFENPGVNKLIALQVAQESGLTIPHTAVVSSKSTLRKLKAQWGRIIHKSMHQGIAVHTEKVLISGQQTEEVTEEVIAQLGDTFFPSLIQQLVPKQFEVRVFCFRNIVRAIATFTQRNALTEIDGRGIDTQKPNRQVPFELPGELKSKLQQVMKRLDLNYGSFDLICTPDNEFIFLEVNPYGQYGFLSMAGNFYLEKEIAEYL